MAVGRTQVGSKFGNALFFDGVNTSTKMNVVAQIDSSTSTLCMFVYINSYPVSGTSSIFQMGPVGTSNGGWEAHINTSGDLLLTDPGTANSLDTSTTLATKTWYHLATTNPGGVSNFTVYVNGSSVGTLSNQYNAPHGQYISFGGTLTNGSVYSNMLNGALDDIRYYTTPLAASDIVNIANRVFPDPTSTVSETMNWTFDQTSGNAVDVIGGNVLTVNSGTYKTGYAYLYNVPLRSSRTTFNSASGRTVTPA